MEKYQFPRIKNEIQFEDFTRDLLNLIHSDTSFQLYGRKGQSQNGLDGYSTFHNIFFQCKHKSSQYLKDTKVEEELVVELDKAKNKILELSKNKISKFLFFTTHSNTTKLQDKARLLSNDEIIVEYWGWESIESYLNDFYLFENKDFYKKYFPELATRLSSSIPPQLTIKSSTYDNTFIGREDEVKVIDRMLKDSNSLLLINGIGGIGKSSLANYYLYTRENEFDYYGFIEGLESFISEFRNSLDLKSEKEEELYREIMFKLQDLKGNKLLVIDNVENIESHKELMEMILSLHKYDYKILFTSRRKIENVTAYPLGTLLLDDARELFLSYSKTDELEKVDEIINYLGLHTLFIKLVAETIENEGYLLDKILEKFEKGELSKIELIDDESGDEVTFNQNLQELFSMQNLNDEYILLLKRLAVLPSIDIELSFLEEILGKERLKGRLNFLVGRGWLIKNDESYKLHQIIKEFLLANYAPQLEEIGDIVTFFIKIFQEINDIQSSNINKTYLIYLESVCLLIERLDIDYSVQSRCFNNLANMYRDIGNYQKIRQLYTKALLLSQKEFGDKHKNTAICYSNLGGFYKLSGDYNKAKEFYTKSLSINKSLFNEEDISVAIDYNNMASLYGQIGKYSESEEFFLKSLILYQNILGDNHLGTAMIYTNLAECYRHMELFDKAIDLALKALSIYELLLGDEHFITARSYNNVGLIYYSLKNFMKAEKFYNRALQIRLKIAGESHPETVMSYNNLASLYGVKGEYEKAEELYNKVLRIRKQIYGEKHTEVAEAYNNYAIFYYVREKFEKAYSYMQKSLDLNRLFLANNHPHILKSKNYLYIIEEELKKQKFKFVSRNTLCPCNSGKKYKKCCGKPK